MTVARRLDKTTRRVIWLLAAVMACSFGFGIVMFVPDEHRAQKLAEMTLKYQARQRRVTPPAALPAQR